MTITEGARKASQDLSVPPTAELWTAIAETPKALEKVTKGKKGASRRTVVERYLSTPITQDELGEETGTTRGAVGTMVSRTLIKVFPLLPPEVQAAYGSAEQALKQRISFVNSAIITRRGQAIDAGTYTGKPLGRRPGSGNGRRG